MINCNFEIFEKRLFWTFSWSFVDLICICILSGTAETADTTDWNLFRDWTSILHFARTEATLNDRAFGVSLIHSDPRRKEWGGDCRYAQPGSRSTCCRCARTTLSFKIHVAKLRMEICLVLDLYLKLGNVWMDQLTKYVLLFLRRLSSN